MNTISQIARLAVLIPIFYLKKLIFVHFSQKIMLRSSAHIVS